MNGSCHNMPHARFASSSRILQLIFDAVESPPTFFGTFRRLVCRLVSQVAHHSIRRSNSCVPTDPTIVWIGAILLRLYFELIGLGAKLTPVLAPFAKRSPNQITALDALRAWFYGLALWAERFEHFTRYRWDPLLPRLLCLPASLRLKPCSASFRPCTYR